LHSRAEDNSLIELKISHDGAHLIALSAIGSSSVLLWNISSASLVASADFQGLQSKIAVLPCDSVLKFATLGASMADVWTLNTDICTGVVSELSQQSVNMSILDDDDYITSAAWISRYCIVVGLLSGRIFIIDVQTYALKSRCPIPQDVGSSVNCLLSSSNHIILGCSDGTIRFLYHEGARTHMETTPLATGYLLHCPLACSPNQCCLRHHFNSSRPSSLFFRSLFQVLSSCNRQRCLEHESMPIYG
jgi:WD40 repeat protein